MRRFRADGRETARAVRPVPRGSGQLRIIGGRWRSRRISVADRPGLRPSPDALRETLYNWLLGALDRPVLDAFAGSGALGFEAASRGAPRVLMIERDAAAHAVLARNAVTLQGDAGSTTPSKAFSHGDGLAGAGEDSAPSVDLVHGDALRWIHSPEAVAWTARHGAFGGVLLDPPFGQALLARWLEGWTEAVKRGVIAVDAWCYTEREIRSDAVGPPGYECLREKRFGETVGALWWPAAPVRATEPGDPQALAPSRP